MLYAQLRLRKRPSAPIRSATIKVISSAAGAAQDRVSTPEDCHQIEVILSSYLAPAGKHHLDCDQKNDDQQGSEVSGGHGKAESGKTHRSRRLVNVSGISLKNME